MLVLECFNGGTRSFLCWVFVSLLALWHRKVERFLAYKCLSVWISGTRVFQGLALSVEGSSNWIARLRAIVQLDCRTACNHAMGLYHTVLNDCWTACIRTIRL